LGNPALGLSRNRANAGLDDPIPLGLKNRPLLQVGRPDQLIPLKTAKNLFLPLNNVARLLQKKLYKPPKIGHNNTIKADESVAKRSESGKKSEKKVKKTLTPALIFEKFAHTRTIKHKIMRTKTLILSGILAALSGASLMAQVYSINAVGYINVDVPPGFSIIADQLYATNQQTSQTIDAILGPTLLSTNASGVDVYAQNGGVVIFLWGGTGFQAPLIVEQLQVGIQPAWSSSYLATNNSFNPGQAAFIYNPGADFQMTFVGQVPQGSVTNVLTPGFNLVSSIVPQTGAIDTDLGEVPGLDDVVYLWNGTGYSAPNVYQSVNGKPAAWSYGASPTNTVGTGFFYFSSAAAGTENNWTRTFNIN
jgi:hypothetical protein